MRLVPPPHLALGASALLLAALYGAHLKAEGALGLFAAAEAEATAAECSLPRQEVKVYINLGDELASKVKAERDRLETDRLDVTVVIPEGWTLSPDELALGCYPVPSVMNVRVRVAGRDFGETHTDPENVPFIGLRLMEDDEGCDVGEVILQDIDVVGVCENLSTGDTAQLVVNDAWTVTLNDVGLSGETNSSGAAANYGLYATSGTITATDLNVSAFYSGFGVKLTDAAVTFEQTGGSYTKNTWGALGSFGATVDLDDVSFTGNQLRSRGLGATWDEDGGSIYASGGSLTLSGVSFSDDYAPQHGGAISLDFVSSFTGCGLSFIRSAAGGYGGAISAHHSGLTLNAGDDGACGSNLFDHVDAPLGAAMSLSQEGDGELIAADLSWLELSQILGDNTISSSLSGSLTLEDVSTPGGLGAAGLLHTDGSSNPKIGPVSATRLHIRGDGEAVPDRGSLISVENTSLTLTESSFCGVVAGDDNAPMISITDANGASVLQRNTIWGGWSEVEGSALVTAKKVRTSNKTTYELMLIDNTLLGSGAERGVTTDESVQFWGVNNLLNNLAIGQSLGGEVVWLSHNLYGVSVLEPLDMNGAEVAVHELVGVQPKLFARPGRGCDQLPLLRPTSPAIGAGPGADDAELGWLNEVLSHNGLEYSSLDDIGAQPVAYTERDRDGDGFADNVDCAALDPEVNPGAEEIPENGLDDDCDPNTPDVVPADQDGDGVADLDDCAPTDPRFVERCEGAIFEYSGGRAGCAAAPTPLGLLGVLVALALTRRRESRFSPL